MVLMNGDQMREEIAIALWRAEEGSRVDWSETNDWWREKYRRSADAVLALPDLPVPLSDRTAPWFDEWFRETHPDDRSLQDAFRAGVDWGAEHCPSAGRATGL